MQKCYDAHGSCYEVCNDNTEAAVDDTTKEEYTAMKQVWKSKMRRKMNTKFQYAISAADTSLNHPLSASFTNAQ